MVENNSEIKVREAREEDEFKLCAFIADFRVNLAAIRGLERQRDIFGANEELSEYQSKDFPIYVAFKDDILVGYMVCRVDGDVVWAESLFVLPGFRRQGVGSALYEQAEILTRQMGGELPYNWVDPDNSGMIQFLQKRGYNILNLIELRYPREGETNLNQIRVGDFLYYR
jgi:GNAT superfamily N-acetyltransferase